MGYETVITSDYATPYGLGAYFAYQVGIFGPQLFGAYANH
jgi:hypothetical protein